MAPLERLSQSPEIEESIPKIRSDIDACPTRFSAAVERLMRIVDGQRLVKVSASDFFKGGVESLEQLDAALSGLREECERLIGKGKKIIVH